MKSFLEKISSKEISEYLTSLSDLPRNIVRGKDGSDLVMTISMTLSNTTALSIKEQSERLEAVLKLLNIDDDAIDSLSLLANQLPPHLTNAIAKHLSPTQKHNLIKPIKKLSFESIQIPTALTSPQSSISVRVVENRIDKYDKGATVILLSKMQNQDANKKLLNENKFSPIIFNDVDTFYVDINNNSDICAVIIDSSFIHDMSSQEQILFFETISGYSTFIWVRIDDTGLKISHEEINSVFKKSRCKLYVEIRDISYQPNGVLREQELSELSRVRDLLRAEDSTRFIPAEINDEEILTLISAATDHLQQIRYEASINVISLETRFLQGGYSPARIALIRINRDGKYIVAKISDKSAVLNEMKRFLEIIKPWDNQLNPKLYFHKNSAVILFDLVSDFASKELPAPMLQHCLEDIWHTQLFNKSTEAEYERKIDNFCDAIEKLAKSISELNIRRPAHSGLSSVGNPSITHLTNIEMLGIDWGLPSDAISARNLAEIRFAQYAMHASIHGDIHLRNILVKNDLDMHLIDYAGSGPGHPAIDLTRLELSLYCNYFKMAELESNCVDFQQDISINLLNKEDIERKYYKMISIKINKIVIRGVVAARDHAIKACESYGGGKEDYLAAKYLVAWQYLAMNGPQTSLVKSIINVLTPAISNW
ncbi:hypothetical protein F6V25_02895 [Oryzomonas japonica]|uniref:Uncharacterized protein n=1 Tax=Oryzomonas japonica TaxID=2603858 RepID=A0A7J4ZVL4_9BACT|nr:hypothetical protein [Oryzomonas japonica]KAB0667658.1 hypothetical protein F6V25_02895 [Oryzomonas japonica]